MFAEVRVATDASAEASSLALSRTTTRHTKHSRAKPHVGWEQHDLITDGFYHRYLDVMLERFPSLTLTEARVAALAAGLLPSREIARILTINEHSVENCRSHIRKKLGLPKSANLSRELQHIVLQSFKKNVG